MFVQILECMDYSFMGFILFFKNVFLISCLNRQHAISLAAQRFIADIAETTLQFNEVHKGKKKKVKRIHYIV